MEFCNFRGLNNVTCSVLATGIAPAFTIVIRIIYPLGEVTNNRKTVARFVYYYTASARCLRKKVCNSRHFHYIRDVIMTNGCYIFFMTVMSMRMHR